MKVLHLTDLHLPAPGRTLWGLDGYDRVGRVFDDLARWHSDAAFCVISGDLTDDGDPGAYRWLAERVAALPMPVHLMIGNHDDREAMRAHLPGLMQDEHGFVQGVRETEAGVFLFLDTFKGGTSAGQYCAARQDWLRARLRRSDGPFHIFMHHPPFDIGVPYMDRIKLDEAEAFARIVEGQRVQTLFFGHVHRAMFQTWQGIACTALPGLNHQVPLERASVATRYSIEPAMIGVLTFGKDAAPAGCRVHLDAVLDRTDADMPG